MTINVPGSHDDPLPNLSEAAKAIAEIHNARPLHDRGATFSLRDGNLRGRALWAVSPYLRRTVLIRGKLLSASDIESFAELNADLLMGRAHAIGTWYNPEDDFTYLDVSVTTETRAEAEAIADTHDQIGIYDLLTGTYHSIGGTGRAP